MHRHHKRSAKINGVKIVPEVLDCAFENLHSLPHLSGRRGAETRAHALNFPAIEVLQAAMVKFGKMHQRTDICGIDCDGFF